MPWLSIPQCFLHTTWPCQVDTQLINEVAPTKHTSNLQTKKIPCQQRLLFIRAQTSCSPYHMFKLIEFFYVIDAWVTNQPLHRGYNKCYKSKANRAHVLLFKMKLALNQSRLPELEVGKPSRVLVYRTCREEHKDAI